MESSKKNAASPEQEKEIQQQRNRCFMHNYIATELLDALENYVKSEEFKELFGRDFISPNQALDALDTAKEFVMKGRKIDLKRPSDV